MVVEDEPFIKQEVVCLDWFNSDLFLRISKENFMVAEPFFKDGWGYVWAGTRATYGFSRGKVPETGLICSRASLHYPVTLGGLRGKAAGESDGQAGEREDCA